MGLLMWPSPLKITIEPSYGKPLEIPVHQAKPKFSVEYTGKHIFKYNQGSNKLHYEGRVISIEEKRGKKQNLFKKYVVNLIAVYDLAMRRIYRHRSGCNCESCRGLISKFWADCAGLHPERLCGEGKILRTTTYIRDRLPSEDMVFLVWKLRNELRIVGRLWFDEPDLRPEFEEWICALPDNEIVKTSWSDWDSNSEDTEWRVAKDLLNTGCYDDVVVYAMYKQ